MNALLLDGPGIIIFGQKIYAYAIIIVFGMLMAYMIITLLFKRRNISGDLFLTFFCVGLPIALVFTRLFFCVTGGVPFKEWFSLSSIRQGGLSIIGGIIGGALGVVIVCIWKKANFLRVADCVVVGLILAQGIGRWGNFANQEVYGYEVESKALQCFPFAVYIGGESCLDTFTLTFQKWFGGGAQDLGGTWHYALFFYEFVLDTIFAGLLFWNAWKNPKKPNGLNAALYFIYYGVLRSIMEPLRDGQYILSEGGVPWSQVVSLTMLVGGVALLIALLVLNKKKEGVLMGSLNGDPYGISKYIADGKDDVATYNKINMMCKIFPENYVQPTPKDNKEKEKKQ